MEFPRLIPVSPQEPFKKLLGFKAPVKANLQEEGTLARDLPVLHCSLKGLHEEPPDNFSLFLRDSHSCKPLEELFASVDGLNLHFGETLAQGREGLGGLVLSANPQTPRPRRGVQTAAVRRDRRRPGGAEQLSPPEKKKPTGASPCR